MRSDTFNAYHKWLGIPPAEQPPNHYRLLGISAFEDDPEVIDRAADGRMIFLRQNQSGPNAHWSQLLLNEVSAARICLLDESSKQRYDEGLRERLDPDLVPLETTAWPMLPEAGRSERLGHNPLAIKPKPKAPKPLIVALAVGVTIVVSGLIALGFLLSVRSDRSTDTSPPLVTRPTVVDSGGLPPLPPQENDAVQQESSSKQVGVATHALKNASSSSLPGASTEIVAAAPRGDERTISGELPLASASQPPSAAATSATPLAPATGVAAPASAPAVQPVPSLPPSSVAAQVSQPVTGAQPGALAAPGVAPQSGGLQPGTPGNPNVPGAPQLPGAQRQSTTPMMGPMRGMPPSGGFMPPFGTPPGSMPPFAAPGQIPGGQPGVSGQPMIPGQPGFGGPFGGAPSNSSSPPVDNTPVPPATLEEVIETLKARDKSPQEVYNRLRALLHLPHDSSRRTEVAALLNPLLTSENATVRSKARELMQTWGTEVNTPTLIKLLSVQDRFDRHDAIKALGAIGGKEAAHAVAARLSDKDDRLYAKAALIKMGPVAEEYVLPQVGASNDDVHDAACDIVGLVGTNKSLSKLRALRRESSTRRRLSVSGAIHELEQRLVKKR